MGLDAAMGINSERHRFKNWTKYDPKGLVGHWTFCSKLPSQNLFKDVAGTTPVNADGERIGYVKNEAPGDGYGNRLGNFLRAMRDTDTYKPVYKVATADDCCGWAEFDNTNADTTEGFVGGVLQGEDATNWGGETSTKFSDLIMNNQNYTMFAVVRPDPADDANTKTFYYQRGARTSGGTGLTQVTYNASFRASTEAYTSAYACVGCSPPTETTTTAPFADNDIHLITTVGRAGTNASYISIDQVQLDTETMDTLMNMDFDSQGDGSVSVQGGAFVSIGYQMAQGNVADAAMGNGFKGRIYEVMVYVGDLQPNAILIVEDFLMKKYCIEPTNPADGRGMVGHWDFTKKIPSSNLTQNVDGTTPVDSTGDPIGYAKNFATGETSTGYKLGDFVRASANDATRPTFGTGGQNGHSYANYGAGGTIGLRAGYFTSGDSDDDGGVSATKFSDLTMSSHNYTAWYVVDNITATGSAARILELTGHGQANTDLGQFKLARGTAGTGSPYLRQEFRDDGIGSYPNNLTWLQNQNENPMADGFKIIAVIGDSGPGATRMFINGTEVSTCSFNCSSDFDVTFSKTSNSGTGSPHVGLGCTTNDAGITSSGWEGRLYEVQVYKGTLSAADFNNVQTFLENKYNVTQEPVLYTISECVAHYDFTDASNMAVEKDGTGGSPSTGDKIGRINNIAPGDSNGYKLVEFLRAGGDVSGYDSRPLFFNGGVNGNSYGSFFDPTLSNVWFNGNRGLRAGYFSDGAGGTVASTLDGGVSATKFSDLEFDILGATVFVVASKNQAFGPVMNSWFANLINMQGKLSGASSGTDNVYFFSAYGTQTLQQQTWIGGDEPNVMIEDPANLQSGLQLFTFKLGSGATAFDMLLDNISVVTGDTTGWTAGSKIHFDQTTTATPTHFSIGTATDSEGKPVDNTWWVGEIYEVLVYNKTLSADELTIVNDYVSTKYGLSIG